jgi:hypothetical protein
VPTIRLEGLDLAHSMLAAASTVLSQLRLLSQLCSGAEHHTRIVLGIIDFANSFGVCSPAALGVSGVLVDHLREADEAQLAHVLVSARTVFTDQELAAGAAALLAAATAFVADAVGVDPMVAHDEIHRPAAQQRPRPRCRRSARSLLTDLAPR